MDPLEKQSDCGGGRGAELTPVRGRLGSPASSRCVGSEGCTDPAVASELPCNRFCQDRLPRLRSPRRELPRAPSFTGLCEEGDPTDKVGAARGPKFQCPRS